MANTIAGLPEPVPPAFPPASEGEVAVPVALGTPPAPAVAPAVAGGVAGDVEWLIDAEDLALAAVLEGRAERFDPQSNGRSASVWAEAVLLVAEDLVEDWDAPEEAPASLLPELLDFGLR